jgi:hypothetical protein
VLPNQNRRTCFSPATGSECFSPIRTSCQVGPRGHCCYDLSLSNRLKQALAAYAVLAIAAYFLLTGTVLLVVLIVLLAFLLKTLLWHFKPED